MAKKATKKKTSRRAKSTTIQDRLNGLQESWEGAEPREGFSPIPDGDYSLRIDTATIEEAKESKRLQVKWAMTVVSPAEFGNRKLWKYDGLDTVENLEWLKGSLATLEVELPDDISELGEALESLAGSGVDVTVKTKDEYQNVYFNGPIDLDEADEDEDDDDDDDDDDTPADDDDDNDDDDDDEEITLGKGSAVTVEFDGKDYAGKVTSINEKKDVCSVKFEDGELVKDIPFDEITLVEEDDD